MGCQSEVGRTQVHRTEAHRKFFFIKSTIKDNSSPIKCMSNIDWTFKSEHTEKRRERKIADKVVA